MDNFFSNELFLIDCPILSLIHFKLNTFKGPCTFGVIVPQTVKNKMDGF